LAFSQTAVTEVRIVPVPSLAVVRVNWTSTAVDGTTFQVYANRQLVWYGTDLQAEFPWPAAATTYAVGTVASGEGSTDFSASLPAQPPQGKARLTWYGGRYLATDLQAFRIYGESAPGSGISYAVPLATVPAQVGPLPLDGLGNGGFGAGGFGLAQIAYTWTSPVVPVSGTWHYAITAVNAAGNESGVTTVAVAVIRPPTPPGPSSNGRRLEDTFNPANRTVTLNWNPIT